MSNAAIPRALITYAICLPLAIFLGYLLGGPLTYSSLATFGIIGLLLAFPLLLKWHYPLLLLSWNMSVQGLLFVPGQPSLWLMLVVLSFVILLMERSIRRESNFIRVRQITLPMVLLAAVVVLTAFVNGGFGFRAFGSEVYGGKKYIYLLAAILGFFALTGRRIPPEKAKFYMSLFFLGGLTSCIGDFFPFTPKPLEFIYWFFPPVSALASELVQGVGRFRGIGAAGFAFYSWMMAWYGIRGIFLSGRPLRLGIFVLSVVISLLGGFRSTLLGIALIFAIQFFLEGLHRTRLLPILALAGALGTVLLIPLAPRLPFQFQRALAFLPFDFNPEVKRDATGSSEWRMEMWEALLPHVKQHLLVGKGFALTHEDYQMASSTTYTTIDPSQQGLALSYDYHNGPLSVLIPFGIWGAIAVLWFLGAAVRVLWRNFKYGDPALRTINAFLLAAFVQHTLMFLFLIGGINSDMAGFAGVLGLSVALNGGVRQREPNPIPTEEPAPAPVFVPRVRPGFQR